MTAAELARCLGAMYRDAPKGKSVAMIHLFGIRYADEIRACGTSPTDLARSAGIPETYGVEVNKGINLAEYVSER